jgi:hypothetical protein
MAGLSDFVTLPEPAHLPRNIDAAAKDKTLADYVSNAWESVTTGIFASPITQFGLHLLAPRKVPVKTDLVAWHAFRNVVAVAGPTYVYLYRGDAWVNQDQPLTNKRFQVKEKVESATRRAGARRYCYSYSLLQLQRTLTPNTTNITP